MIRRIIEWVRSLNCEHHFKQEDIYHSITLGSTNLQTKIKRHLTCQKCPYHKAYWL